jgi:hypothetical protein
MSYVKYAAGAVAALVLAAFVGAVAALATAGRLDDDGERLVRSEQPRFELPELDERRFGDPGLFRFGWGGPAALDLDAAADYLGISEDDLRDELADGSSLSDIARDEGKSVEGLVQALVDAAEERIDDAVAAGRLSEEQADDLKEDLEERIEERVDDELRIPKPFGFEHDFEWPGGYSG